MSSVTPNSVGTDFSSKLESLADKLSLVLPSNILLPCLLAIYLPDITSLYASNFLQTPEPWPSRPASRPSPQDSGPDTGEGGAPCTPSGCSDRRRDAAARTLQARWKAYKHKKKKADLDEVAAALQAAFRGHLVRAKLLSSNARGSQIPSLPNQVTLGLETAGG